jgi:hypothetical protein
MPKIDIANLKVDVGGGHPQPYRVLFAGRLRPGSTSSGST